MSGRAIRRLPVLVLAQYLGMGSMFPHANGVQHNVLLQGAADIDIWLDGMECVIQEQTKERTTVMMPVLDTTVHG